MAALAPTASKPRARAVRNIAAVFVVVGLVVGTVVWQTDDTWPFAQMRMFPGGEESNITYVAIEAEFADGVRRQLSSFAFHLKRADVEGQMPRIREDPSMLGDLIDAYNEGKAGDRRIVALRLIERTAQRGERGRGERWTSEELLRWPE